MHQNKCGENEIHRKIFLKTNDRFQKMSDSMSSEEISHEHSICKLNASTSEASAESWIAVGHRPTNSPSTGHNSIASASLLIADFEPCHQPSSLVIDGASNFNLTSLSSSSQFLPKPISTVQTHNVSESSVYCDSKPDVDIDGCRNAVSSLPLHTSSEVTSRASTLAEQTVNNDAQVPELEVHDRRHVPSTSSKQHDVPFTKFTSKVVADDDDDWPDFPHSPLPFCLSNIPNSYLGNNASTSNTKFSSKFNTVEIDRKYDWPNLSEVPYRPKVENENAYATTSPSTESLQASLSPTHFSSPIENFILTRNNVSEIPSCSKTPTSCDTENSSSSFSLLPGTSKSLPGINAVSSSCSKNALQSETDSCYCFPHSSQTSDEDSTTSHSANLVGIDDISDLSPCRAESTSVNSDTKQVAIYSLDSQHASSSSRNTTDGFAGAAAVGWPQGIIIEDEVSRRARALVRAGFHPTNRETDGTTAAHMACKTGVTSTLAALLHIGADPNAKDQLGWTPLHYAARYNHTSCVKLLMSRGANVEARNVEGKTPLHVASASCAREATRVLLAAGANKWARDENGNTPLDTAHSVEVRRERLVGRLSGRFLSKKGFGHWTFWRNLLEKERKIQEMLDNMHRDW